MNYHKITNCDIANGPGVRVVLWVSGCNHKCKNCHNPQTWDVNSGRPYSFDDNDYLLDLLSRPYNQGLTISGGDPLHPANRECVGKIIRTVRNEFPHKDIWLYTGYQWEEIRSLDFIPYVDVIVDGEYVAALRNLVLPYCGSTNQRVIDVQSTLDCGEIVLYGIRKEK